MLVPPIEIAGITFYAMTENAKKVFIYLTRCHYLNEGIVPEPEEIADKLGLTEEETRIAIDEVFTLIKEQL